MPNLQVTERAASVGRLLGDWAIDRTSGGPLAHHDHVLVSAFAGAGKSHHLTDAVARAIQHEARILVVALTNGQVRDLAHRLQGRGFTVLHYAAVGEEIGKPPPGLISGNDVRALARARCVVTTVYQAGKLAKTEAQELGTFDVGFIDEAFQVGTTPEALNALTAAKRWAFIGDPAQIAVFTRLGTSPFLGADDPVTSIVASARTQGCDLGVLEFDWTWRLPNSGAQLLEPFYGRRVQSAAEDEDRVLTVGPRQSLSSNAQAADECVDRAAALGLGFLQLPGDPLEAADPQTAAGVTAIVTSLLSRTATTTCERDGTRPLGVADIGVMVSTEVQQRVTAQTLSAAGFGDVKVRTYNGSQGLEFPISLQWHPLSGVEDTDGFSLDLGRLCVGLSRHRQACIIVGRGGLRRVLDNPPLSPEAPWPGERDRFLAGWLAHVGLMERLDDVGASVIA
ncbi:MULTISPECIES: AAA family ATPase [unclassified Modestobacter]